MTRSTRFGGLMGSLEETVPTEAAAPAGATAAPDTSETAAAPDTSTPAAAEPARDPDLAPAPVTVAVEDVPEKKTRAKVQLNTQQPEELKNAADKAAAYLSFTTGKKITTTDVVERALRMYLDQLPDAAKGI